MSSLSMTQRAAVTSCVCLAACLMFVMPAHGASARPGTGQMAKVSSLRTGIDFYRRATWRWQDVLGVPHTPTRYSERRETSIQYLRWSAKRWHARSIHAKAAIRRLTSNRGYLPPGKARILGKLLAAQIYGWTGSEWACLDELWGTKNGQRLESGWFAHADNPHSDAYGIPQALPGSKMGAGWRESAYVQIKWGLGYIKHGIQHGFQTPCQALHVRLTKGSY
jgi:hypothetical protein